MQLTLIRKDARSGDTNCPALYRTDSGDYVVVGQALSDTSEVSAGLADGEVAVLVPANVLDDTTGCRCPPRSPRHQDGRNPSVMPSKQLRELPPNDLLRRARQRLPSPSGSGRTMSRQELADAVNTYLARRHQRVTGIDATYVGKLERGRVRWPLDVTREAFRHVLGTSTDNALGFHIVRGLRNAAVLHGTGG